MSHRPVRCPMDERSSGPVRGRALTSGFTMDRPSARHADKAIRRTPKGLSAVPRSTRVEVRNGSAGGRQNAGAVRPAANRPNDRTTEPRPLPGPEAHTAPTPSTKTVARRPFPAPPDFEPGVIACRRPIRICTEPLGPAVLQLGRRGVSGADATEGHPQVARAAGAVPGGLRLLADVRVRHRQEAIPAAAAQRLLDFTWDFQGSIRHGPKPGTRTGRSAPIWTVSCMSTASSRRTTTSSSGTAGRHSASTTPSSTCGTAKSSG